MSISDAPWDRATRRCSSRRRPVRPHRRHSRRRRSSNSSHSRWQCPRSRHLAIDSSRQLQQQQQQQQRHQQHRQQQQQITSNITRRCRCRCRCHWRSTIFPWCTHPRCIRHRSLRSSRNSCYHPRRSHCRCRLHQHRQQQQQQCNVQHRLHRHQ